MSDIIVIVCSVYLVCVRTEAACLRAWLISSLMSDRFLVSVSPSMLNGFIRSMRFSVRCSASSSFRCASLAECSETGSVSFDESFGGWTLEVEC